MQTQKPALFIRKERADFTAAKIITRRKDVASFSVRTVRLRNGDQGYAVSLNTKSGPRFVTDTDVEALHA